MLLLLAGGIWGCTNEDKHPTEPGVYVDTNKTVYIRDMKPQDVIMIVNGEVCTKADFLSQQRIDEKIYRLHEKIQLWGINKKAAEYVWKSEQRIPEYLLQRMLLTQEADRLGIVADPGRVAADQKKLARHMNCPDMPFEEIAAQFGPDGNLLISNVANDIRADILREREATNGVSEVTEAEIDGQLAKAREFNANADRLNAKSRAKALKFREEVLAGKGDFAALAKKYAQVFPEHGEKWGDFEISELPDDWELKKWLASAKPGDISEPLDTPDGLAVVGFVGQYTHDVMEGMAKPVENRLVKCTFYIYEKRSESRAVIRDVLKRKKTEAAQKGLMARLFDAAVIEYPNGINWFPPYSPQKKSAAKGKAKRGKEKAK